MFCVQFFSPCVETKKLSYFINCKNCVKLINEIQGGFNMLHKSKSLSKTSGEESDIQYFFHKKEISEKNSKKAWH